MWVVALWSVGCVEAVRCERGGTVDVCSYRVVVEWVYVWRILVSR